MALASAYAISGLSQGELCSTIYGPSRFIELPIAALPLSEALPPDLILHRWSYCDIDSGAPLLIPLESRILDHQRLAAQTNRDTDRATRLHPPRSPFALLPKCLTWRVSPQEPEGTTNVFCMNAIGLSGIIPARGPRQRVIGNSFSAALFARRMPPQRTTHTTTSFGPANTPC